MFFTLLKYEFKKLFKKRSVWIIVIISALCIPISLLFNLIFYTVTIDTERGSLSGQYLAVLKADIAQDKELSGRPIDDDFISFLQEAEKVSEIGESYDKNSPEYIRYIRAYDNAQMYVTDTLKMSYSDPADMTAENFYKMRSEYMEEEWDYYLLDESAKKYLKAMDEKNSKPFTYRYCSAYDIISMGISIGGVLLVFAAAICVPGIFVEDKRTRTDRIVYSSKHGKTLVYGVKTTAAALFLIADFLLVAVITVITAAAFYGLEGFDAPVQMFELMSAMNLTCGEAVLILAGMGIAEGLILSVMCMIISEFTSSGTPVIVTLLVMFMTGRMINFEPSHKILIRLWDILPSQIAFYYNAFSVKLFKAFGRYFFAYQAAPVIYLAVSAVLIWVGYMHYKRYQTK
ncbi:MAG: hypothetical protein K2N60_08750 [Oscillospiraceae bacterium]|nr:hypothetical protein [Oscillospiraceae bacterium]